MMKKKNIKNILFDLGGVILNLDIDRCIRSFVDLGFKNIDQSISKTHPSGIIKLMETGKIDSAGFVDMLNKEAGLNVPREKILQAWGSFLMDVPLERRQLLARLKSDYKIFLLSNTSPHHASIFEKHFHLNDDFKQISDFFDETYYSFRIGESKPHAQTFSYVLNDAHIKAEETLFIDDSLINTKAANQLGFNCITLNNGTDLCELDFENIEKNATFVAAQ